MTISYQYKCPRCQSPIPSSAAPTACDNCGATFTATPAEKISEPDPDRPGWNGLAGFLFWLFSIVLMYGAAIPAFAAWMGWQVMHGVSLATLREHRPNMERHPELVIFLLLATFTAQLLTIFAGYLLIVKKSKGEFLTALGWHWHPRFRLPHTIGLTVLIFIMVGLISSQFPHVTTDLERILESSLAARLITATLAVVGAPFVEEVTYRGILYAGLRKQFGRWPAILGVSFLFLAVHGPQYWPAWGVLASLGLLSFTLTMVRAYTSSLLPCFIIHLLFNGVQAIGIILQGLIKQ